MAALRGSGLSVAEVLDMLDVYDDDEDLSEDKFEGYLEVDNMDIDAEEEVSADQIAMVKKLGSGMCVRTILYHHTRKRQGVHMT